MNHSLIHLIHDAFFIIFGTWNDRIFIFNAVKDESQNSQNLLQCRLHYKSQNLR